MYINKSLRLAHFVWWLVICFLGLFLCIIRLLPLNNKVLVSVHHTFCHILLIIIIIITPIIVIISSSIIPHKPPTLWLYYTCYSCTIHVIYLPYPSSPWRSYLPSYTHAELLFVMCLLLTLILNRSMPILAKKIEINIHLTLLHLLFWNPKGLFCSIHLILYFHDFCITCKNGIYLHATPSYL